MTTRPSGDTGPSGRTCQSSRAAPGVGTEATVVDVVAIVVRSTSPGRVGPVLGVDEVGANELVGDGNDESAEDGDEVAAPHPVAATRPSTTALNRIGST
jgi:hypothetical protein